MAGIKKLLFVDTNIWLDFYRARTEAGLSLLEHLDQIADKIIVTSQLEMEFKKNRLGAMKEGVQELKPTQGLSRPGFFSNAKEVRAIQSSQRKAESRLKSLKARYVRAFKSPEHDPVYQICQRIFHKEDALVLTREMPERKSVRRRALRRFLLGCPPRKAGDTSMGDAFNWEWMIDCAISQNAELVIVSRDSDYGTIFENVAYPNDHLVQEFRERVSRKRKLLLYSKLSEALQHFEIKVTETEKQEEEAIVQTVEPQRESDRALLSTRLVAAEIAQSARTFAEIARTPEWEQRIKAWEEAFRALKDFRPQGKEPPPGS